MMIKAGVPIMAHTSEWQVLLPACALDWLPVPPACIAPPQARGALLRYACSLRAAAICRSAPQHCRPDAVSQRD
jgi:hypothetical protein